MSPGTARWQQQVNSSFEALVSGALLSPHHQADCSDWRYAVEDLRSSVCLTTDDLQRKDWSLRHLEQRSDSRDSGLESDAAADKHHVGPTKQPMHSSTEDHHSKRTSFTSQQNERLMADLLKMDTITPSYCPPQLHMYTETANCLPCGVLGRKKLDAMQKMQQHVIGDEQTNGVSSCCQHSLDNGTATIPRHQNSVSPVCDISNPHNLMSKCSVR